MKENYFDHIKQMGTKFNKIKLFHTGSLKELAEGLYPRQYKTTKNTEERIKFFNELEGEICKHKNRVEEVCRKKKFGVILIKPEFHPEWKNTAKFMNALGCPAAYAKDIFLSKLQLALIYRNWLVWDPVKFAMRYFSLYYGPKKLLVFTHKDEERYIRLLRKGGRWSESKNKDIHSLFKEAHMGDLNRYEKGTLRGDLVFKFFMKKRVLDNSIFLDVFDFLGVYRTEYYEKSSEEHLLPAIFNGIHVPKDETETIELLCAALNNTEIKLLEN